MCLCLCVQRIIMIEGGGAVVFCRLSSGHGHGFAHVSVRLKRQKIVGLIVS